MKNLKMIEDHNAEEESYKLALNKFAEANMFNQNYSIVTQ